MKIAAVVILYHPIEKEVNNIKTYIEYVDHLYIFDNTENISNENLVKSLQNKYSYFSNKTNEGLCIPLNKAMDLALENDFDYLLCMDQDSYFMKPNIERYLLDINNYLQKDRVGQFGLWYKKTPIDLEENTFTESRPYLITSSSVINLKVIKKYNIRFDENLFIDSVDFDFSFSIILHGLKNVLFSSNYFVHNLGEHVKRSSYKSLFLIKKRKRIHSPKRVYYMKRNLLYLNKKYKNSILLSKLKIIKHEINGHIKSCFNYSKNPLEVLKYIRKAKKDFKENRMGKFIE